jgi:hypothetical protein
MFFREHQRLAFSQGVVKGLDGTLKAQKNITLLLRI